MPNKIVTVLTAAVDRFVSVTAVFEQAGDSPSSFENLSTVTEPSGLGAGGATVTYTGDGDGDTDTDTTGEGLTTTFSITRVWVPQPAAIAEPIIVAAATPTVLARLASLDGATAEK